MVFLEISYFREILEPCGKAFQFGDDVSTKNSHAQSSRQNVVALRGVGRTFITYPTYMNTYHWQLIKLV
jgi:ABC-type sulfate transport system substrate-binding protein